MDSKEFVTQVRQVAVEDNLRTHKQILETTKEAKDPTWKDVLPIYSKLSDPERKAFLRFLRLVEVNTVSIIFGILDGSTYLSEENIDFKLITNDNGEQINGDLQDMFLEMEE